MRLPFLRVSLVRGCFFSLRVRCLDLANVLLALASGTAVSESSDAGATSSDASNSEFGETSCGDDANCSTGETASSYDSCVREASSCDGGANTFFDSGMNSMALRRCERRDGEGAKRTGGAATEQTGGATSMQM